jgi:hypothetical protein
MGAKMKKPETHSIPARFRHVSNRLLRELLEKEPAQVRMEDVKTAITTTIINLGYDAIRDDVTGPTFEARRMAARDAQRSRNKADKHAALRKFWLS